MEVVAAADGTLVRAALLAVTVKEYFVPLVSPVTSRVCSFPASIPVAGTVKVTDLPDFSGVAVTV